MKTSSAKAKGRNLQNKVVELILENFPSLTDLDVRSTPMGTNGEDVMMSSAAKQLFPYSVECKNQEGFAKVHTSFAQAIANTKGTDKPLLVIKSNRRPPLAVLRLEDFMELTRVSNDKNNKS